MNKQIEIIELSHKLSIIYPSEPVLAESYGLTPGSEVVFETINLPDKKHREITVNLSTKFGQQAEPPFEWKLELFFPETVEHYLWLVNGRFVRAERKEFFDVTENELKMIKESLNRHLTKQQ